MGHGIADIKIKEFSKNKMVASISTNYFGGFGDQTANLYIDGEKEYEGNSEYDTSTPINDVLKKMGVERDVHNDEFDMIHLGRYRSNSDFYNELINKPIKIK